MAKHKRQRKPGEAAHSTVTPADVTLKDDDLDTLEAIIEAWNKSKKEDAPSWNAQTVLAELALLAVRSMHGDYGPNERPPNFSNTQDNPPAPLTDTPAKT